MLHDQGVQRTSPKINFRCVAHGEHVLTGARAGIWRAGTCSPLIAALRSTRCCTAPPARPPAPPETATTTPPPSPPPPALLSSTLCSSSGAAAVAHTHCSGQRALFSLRLTPANDLWRSEHLQLEPRTKASRSWAAEGRACDRFRFFEREWCLPTMRKKCGRFGASFARWRALLLCSSADLYYSRRALSIGIGV